ncbi:MAG TPA: hypothetical protein VEP90_18955, partial [Methylomirabilota bacterium]|nr:hypothetical protein [Methylomirabilota bacterium]
MTKLRSLSAIPLDEQIKWEKAKKMILLMKNSNEHEGNNAYNMVKSFMNTNNLVWENRPALVHDEISRSIPPSA